MTGRSGSAEFDDLRLDDEPYPPHRGGSEQTPHRARSGCLGGLSWGLGCLTAPVAAVVLVGGGFVAGMYVQREFLTEKPANITRAIAIDSEGMHPVRKEVLYEDRIKYTEKGVHQRMRGWARDRSKFVDWVARNLGDSEVDMEITGNCEAGIDHDKYPPIYDADPDKRRVTATIGVGEVFGCRFESPEPGQERRTGMDFIDRGGGLLNFFNAPPELYELLTDHGFDALVLEAKRQRMDDEATRRGADIEYDKLKALGYDEDKIRVRHYDRLPPGAIRPNASPIPVRRTPSPTPRGR